MDVLPLELHWIIWKYIHIGYIRDVHHELRARVPAAESQGILRVRRSKRQRRLYWRRAPFYTIGPGESVSKYHCVSVDLFKGRKRYWYKNMAPVHSWNRTIKSEAGLPQVYWCTCTGKRKVSRCHAGMRDKFNSSLLQI